MFKSFLYIFMAFLFFTAQSIYANPADEVKIDSNTIQIAQNTTTTPSTSTAATTKADNKDALKETLILVGCVILGVIILDAVVLTAGAATAAAPVVP